MAVRGASEDGGAAEADRAVLQLQVYSYTTKSGSTVLANARVRVGNRVGISASVYTLKSGGGTGWQELRKELARARREGERRAKVEQEEAAGLRVKLSAAREHHATLAARVEELEGRLREVKEGLASSAGGHEGGHAAGHEAGHHVSGHAPDVAGLVRPES